MHALIYSKHAERVRAFLSEILGWKAEDAGEGWPIFAAPPTEVAVHPTDGDIGTELYLVCDEIHDAVGLLAQHGVPCTPIANRGWGLVTTVTMPGGETIGMYEPRHPSPLKK